MRGRDGGSTVSMFLTRCSANVSHAVAIANMVRFASGSLNVSASSRHLSAFSRYCPTRSGVRPVPAVRKTVGGNVAQISLFQGYSSSGDERGLQSSRSVCARAPAGGVLWTAALFKLGHSGITRRPMTPVRVAGLIACRRRESPLKMPLVQKHDYGNGRHVASIVLLGNHMAGSHHGQWLWRHAPQSPFSRFQAST
jgi:hypothetical protein